MKQRRQRHPGHLAKLIRTAWPTSSSRVEPQAGPRGYQCPIAALSTTCSTPRRCAASRLRMSSCRGRPSALMWLCWIHSCPSKRAPVLCLCMPEANKDARSLLKQLKESAISVVAGVPSQVSNPCHLSLTTSCCHAACSCRLRACSPYQRGCPVCMLMLSMCRGSGSQYAPSASVA